MGNLRAAGGAWALALLLGLPAPAQEAAKKPPTDVERVLARLNEHRTIAGLDPVVEDKELSKGCQLHAEYLAQNHDRAEIQNGGAHREEKNLPGYTEAGHKSAARSVVSPWGGVTDLYHHVDSLMATLYHRVALLENRVRRVGIGVSRFKASGKVLVIDPRARDPQISPKTYPVLYPSPNQRGVPLSFSFGGGEWPDPRPDKAVRAGYPITVSCDVFDWQPGRATGALVTNGNEVPVWVFTRENPAVMTMPAQEVVCILPKEPFKPKTKYTVTVTCKMYGIEKTPEWSKTWSFTTAEKDEPGGEIRKEE